MKLRFRWLLLTALAILATGLFLWNTSFAQRGRSEFPETGHILGGAFYRVYWSIEDPLLLYGYPITDSTRDPTTGKVVQYFERAVFMLNHDDTLIPVVDLAPLGKYLYEPGESSVFVNNPVECHDFSDTGYQVCHAFREFFEAHGGVEQFGLPISNLEIQRGRIIQYFERARFEWFPEAPPGERVRLGDLGREFFQVIGDDPDKLRSNRLSYDVLEIFVQTSPARPVTISDTDQTIYMLVHDQNHQPIHKARVELVVSWPSGKEEIFQAEPTDEKGISKITFEINPTSSGQVLLHATAVYGDFTNSATNSFRILE